MQGVLLAGERPISTLSTMASEHLQDDEIELYLLGMSGGAAVERIEKHLLRCHLCLRKISVVQDYIEAVRSALTHFAAEQN